VIVAGGHTDGTIAGMTDRVEAFGLPSCLDPSPSTVRPLADLPRPTWAAASAVTTAGMFVIGGVISGDSCSREVFRLADLDGKWQAMAQLPRPLCHASAVTMYDVSNGHEYIVVAGGLQRASLRKVSLPFTSLNDATLVYDIAANTWTRFTGAGQVIEPLRFDMGAASSGNLALFVGGNMANSGPTAALHLAQTLTISGGVPSFGSATDLPVGVALPGVAALGGQFIVNGGVVDEASAIKAGTRTWALDAAALTADWTERTPSPRARHGGALLPSNDGRLIHVAGALGALDDFTPIATVDEWNP
jgi:hypothetical protein